MKDITRNVAGETVSYPYNAHDILASMTDAISTTYYTRDNSGHRINGMPGGTYYYLVNLSTK